jgi:hypothetical protein
LYSSESSYSVFSLIVSLTRVRHCAGRELEDERDASGIAETMNFTGEPASRTAKRLFRYSPFCAGSRDMTANRRRIQAVAGVVGHRLGEGRGDRFPDAGLAPSSEALIDHHPLTVLLRQIAPRRLSADPPQDAIDDLPIVERGPDSCVLAPAAEGVRANATPLRSGRRDSILPPSKRHS